MTSTLPEEAVKAAVVAMNTGDMVSYDSLNARQSADARRILTAALPFLPVQGAAAGDCPCTKTQQDETCPVGYPSLLCEICDGKGVLQPSTARKLALEEILREVDEIERKVWAWSGSAFLNNELEGAEDADCKTELYSELCGIGNTMHWLRTKICTLSSPEPSTGRVVAMEKEEFAIDKLRFRAFHTNSDTDRQAYFDAVSKWFQDRHIRRMNAERALSSPDHADAGKFEGDGWLPMTHPDLPLNGASVVMFDSFAPGKDGFGQVIARFDKKHGWHVSASVVGGIYIKLTNPIKWRPLFSAPASEGAE